MKTMNKEIRELLNKIQNKKAEAKNLLNDKKVTEAKAMVDEIKALEQEYEVQMALLEDEKEGIKMKKDKEVKNEVPLEIRAFKAAISGKPLSPEFQNAITEGGDGGYLVPTVLIEQIALLRRQFVSLRDYTSVIPVSSSKGSLPIEDESNFSVLVDFDEVSDLADIDTKFNNVTFSIKNRGGIVAMSNTLLDDQKTALPNYVVQNFSRKLIRTENKDILAILQGKTAKQFADFKALKKSFNKDIDPGLKGDGFVFIVNQSSYGYLDDLEDSMGRPLLQPNPTQSTGKLLFGFPVVVLADNELANTVSGANTFAPVIFGNLLSAVGYFDRNEMEIAASSEYYFGKNMTALRVITRFDTEQLDANAWVNGQVDVTTYIA